MYDDLLQVSDFGRKGLLIIGEWAIDIKPFQERGLIPKKVKMGDVLRELNYSKAIIVAASPSKYATIKEFYNRLAEMVSNYGLKIIVLVHNDRDFNNIQAIANRNPKDLHFISKISELPELIARYSPGPPAEPVNIETLDTLSEEITLLLQRSFFGCSKIHLQSISGGKASLGLYKVIAWIEDSRVGPMPLPFFAKIGEHEQIHKEQKNYREFTDLYIPFRFRPNCRLERCVNTMNYASLVGNFVEDAIPLRKALQETHSSGVIFSLFERSLHGFRVQPIVARKPKTVGGLKKFIKSKVKLDVLIGNTNLIRRAKEFGLKSSVQNLFDKLILACPQACLTGPYHGDLNAKNIMVNGGDAILIDFCSIENEAPLTADPATIEISLSFDVNEPNPASFDNWKEFIDVAYNPDTLTEPIALTEIVPDEFSWLRRAIRETRYILIGCDCCDDEIKAIIACYILRIARLTSEAPSNKIEEVEFEYRAYALVIAERIIESLK